MGSHVKDRLRPCGLDERRSRRREPVGPASPWTSVPTGGSLCGPAGGEGPARKWRASGAPGGRARAC